MDMISEGIKISLKCCVRYDCSKCNYIYSTCYRGLARDALEQIEELEQKVPKWVSIKDRLPEHVRGNYLILLGGEIYAAKWEYDEWNEKYAFRIDCQIVPNVTHWMKVPEPPEEENYDGLS